MKSNLISLGSEMVKTHTNKAKQTKPNTYYRFCYPAGAKCTDTEAAKNDKRVREAAHGTRSG